MSVNMNIVHDKVCNCEIVNSLIVIENEPFPGYMETSRRPDSTYQQPFNSKQYYFPIPEGVTFSINKRKF